MSLLKNCTGSKSFILKPQIILSNTWQISIAENFSPYPAILTAENYEVLEWIKSEGFRNERIPLFSINRNHNYKLLKNSFLEYKISLTPFLQNETKNSP